MIEKRWKAVPPVALTANGTKYGELTLVSTKGFKAKQKVILSHPINGKVELEVRRVTSNTKLELGELGTGFADRANLTAYDSTCSLRADELPRNSIPEDQIDRAVYEEEPTVAIRTIAVDRFGEIIDTQNPLPVQIPPGSISIGALDVQLTHEDDNPNSGDVHDSVRIGDGVDELEINADGSINVNVVSGSSNDEAINVFNDVAVVASGATTTLLTYTVPVGKNLLLSKIEAGGENIAAYEVVIDGSIEARKRTHHATGLFAEFSFEALPRQSYKVEPGKIVLIRTLHGRPTPGTFEARILGVLEDV